MASNSKLKITFEPLIFIIFSGITVLVFLLSTFIPSLKLDTIFTSPTSPKGPFPFSFADPLSWCRIFLYIFGTKALYNWILLGTIAALFPEQETNYGTLLLTLMIIISTAVSGVLFACFSVTSITGPVPVICLLFILKLLSGLRKKTLSIATLITFIFLGVFCITSENTPKENVLPFFINLAGGLIGSLVSFITVKKSSGNKKKGAKKKDDIIDEPETVVYFDNEADSPRFKNKSKKTKNNADEEETIIGTIEL